jgi:mevalonate kinase
MPQLLFAQLHAVGCAGTGAGGGGAGSVLAQQQQEQIQQVGGFLAPKPSA